MTNLDMKKTLKHLYAASSKDVNIVDVPPLPYLMIDGEGNPNTAPRYTQSVQALYKLAYSIRAISKAGGTPFTVMPLEGLWWFKGEPNTAFYLTDEDKDRFEWTLMILMPPAITDSIVAKAKKNALQKGDVPCLTEIRFETYHEGEATQIMHIGPYKDEGPTVQRLHRHIEDNGWRLRNKHHEIYLSDPRKTSPEKMKTIIRQPFRRA